MAQLDDDAPDGAAGGVAVVFARALGRRELRRAVLAYGAFAGAEYGWWIAMLVYAFRIGGTSGAAVAAAGQLLPATVIAPLTAALPDRFRPGRVLALGFVAQAVPLVAAGALVVADLPAPVFACLVLANIAITVVRPAYNVLLPSLARTADELTAANVLGSWMDAVGILGAAALTGVLLAVADVSLALLSFGLLAGIGALLVRPPPGAPPVAAETARSALAEAVAGLVVLREQPQLRLLMLVASSQFVLVGACDVLFVVLAVDTLRLGEGWAGYFNALFGAGGLVGAALAASLVGRRRIAPVLALAGLVAGAAFAGLSAQPVLGIAIVALLVAGGARTVFDTAGRTLLQRCTPPAVLGRVFGGLEALYMGGLALGSLVVPAFVAASGIRVGLLACGAILPLAVILGGRRLLRLDHDATVPVVELALLRSLPIFRGLPAPALEGIARALVPLEVASGEAVVREGEPGDSYYVIADGEVEALRAGLPPRRMGRGDGFGEIALLHDVPRTATVLATRATSLYTLAREPFLVALTGHAPSHDAAREIARSRSAGDHDDGGRTR